MGQPLRQRAAVGAGAGPDDPVRPRRDDHRRDRLPVRGLDHRARHPGRRPAHPALARSRWRCSYGATPRRRSTRKIILWAALPEILAGIRLGVIRGVKGVVIGQLLVSIIGYGELFELYSRGFVMEQFWALTIILFAVAMLLSGARRSPSSKIEYLRRSETMNVHATAPAYVFEPPPLPTLPVRGSDQLFPVHRIYCVGRNYAEHAIEMGHDPNREPPFFFQKNPDNLVHRRRRSRIRERRTTCISRSRWWSRSARAARTSRSRRRSTTSSATRVGLDMTRRDLQGEAKKLGRPWEVGKAFERSAPCSAIVPASRDRPPGAGRGLARGQRRARAERRPQPDDLEGAGDDRLPLRPVRRCSRAT